MDLGRYVWLGLAVAAALVLARFTVRPSGSKSSMPTGAWLLLLALAIFIAVDVATGQALTNIREPSLVAGAMLIFLTVVLVDIVVLARRAHKASR